MLVYLTDECLMTTAQVAARLSISTKTLLLHVRDGEIGCVNIGTGLRKHRRFALSQIAEFISNRQTREIPPCLSINLKQALSTTTTSGSTAIAFTELPRPETKGTRKP
ncbi:helix-turn-helix domain-containing protein [Ensifer sp. PDNC004]|uniref:helix-turn-helix domain-containing protein n=1 Tax=Ensifer sp. PDNC004 TaxID=2811423 RepID=UPI0019631175|nr:helix-turn-helix domain-containing protein [Ensifer sp. PDNC004]